MKTERMVSIVLDERSLRVRTPESLHERNTAINDLLQENQFAPTGLEAGPYDVTLRVAERRLTFDITSAELENAHAIALSLKPLRGIIRDYFMICESYFEALKTRPDKIEAIDMGRRGIHNEGAEMLQGLLEGKIVVDFNTSRRLFTLICVLHLK